MKISILIPHYKNGKATAYAVYKFLQHKGKHDIDIFISDNNSGDGSIEYVKHFSDKIKVIDYPKDKLQSHGIALDMMIPLTDTDYFITAESDSFPTDDEWLDYIEDIVINGGYDMAGSLMQLSGGEYIHGAGAVYSKKMWAECKKYCDNIPYTYFPNMWNKEGFDGHTMIHDSVLQRVLTMPEDYFDLAEGYKGLSTKEMLDKAIYYSSVVCPFHNGMGMRQESVKTYGQRNAQSESPNIMLDGNSKIIFRVGYEPNQFIYYWALANNKKILEIPTTTKWMDNRIGQQQEYTKMINGFIHLWCGSSYLDMKDTEMDDVYRFKSIQIEQLYQSLPEQFKISL